MRFVTNLRTSSIVAFAKCLQALSQVPYYMDVHLLSFYTMLLAWSLEITICTTNQVVHNLPRELKCVNTWSGSHD